MSLAAGSKLGPYEIVSALGAGGMGEVYRANDTRLRRDVAIKVLPANVAHDAERLRRFEQEALATAALSHPNILVVYDIGYDGDTAFVVEELLEGRTLREVIDAGGVTVRKAVGYASQIADGLAAAHDKGIVHRDLKPENLFVTPEDRVKILDFVSQESREQRHPQGRRELCSPLTPSPAWCSEPLATWPPNRFAALLSTIARTSSAWCSALRASHRTACVQGRHGR